MTDDELAALERRNRTAHATPPRFVPELVEERAADVPHATAVISETVTLSYGELNARANRLAHHLAARGIGAEDVVVIALPRSADMITGLLAALKTGAAYLTLDVKAPEQRLRAVLDDCRPAVVLTDTAHRPLLGGAHSARALVLDAEDTGRLLAGAPETDLTDADRIRPLTRATPPTSSTPRAPPAPPRGSSCRWAP